jgi:hypothetical protein
LAEALLGFVVAVECARIYCDADECSLVRSVLAAKYMFDFDK